MAGLVAGFALARWLYRTPPKAGQWPKAITSDGETMDQWEDAIFHEQVISVNAGQPPVPTKADKFRAICREIRARLTWKE
jgi:hypothetical protein